MAFFTRKKHQSSDEPKTVSPVHISNGRRKGLLSYQAANLQGIGTRKRQEDSFGFVNATDVTKIRKNGFAAIVADGMGGMKDGSFASKTAVNMLRNTFETLDYSESISEQINDGILSTCKAVYDELHGYGGSTVIACLLYKGELYYSSVGDSYLMLKRGNMLYRLNRPHNVLHSDLYDEIKRGSTDSSMAMSNPGGAAVTQYLGKEEIDDIDFFRTPLKLLDGDVIMACSDGVAGVLSEECMLSCLSCISPNQMCEELEKNILALNRKNQDNYTALVIKCEY